MSSMLIVNRNNVGSHCIHKKTRDQSLTGTTCTRRIKAQWQCIFFEHRSEQYDSRDDSFHRWMKWMEIFEYTQNVSCKKFIMRNSERIQFLSDNFKCVNNIV